jgi:hypothetical protein
MVSPINEEHIQLLIPYGKIAEGMKSELLITLKDDFTGDIHDNLTGQTIHITSHEIDNIRKVIDLIADFLNMQKTQG